MSWTIQIAGAKDALQRAIANVMTPLVEASAAEPYRSEYKGAQDALSALVNSMPEGGFYLLKGNGSTSVWTDQGKGHVHGQASMSIESYTPVM